MVRPVRSLVLVAPRTLEVVETERRPLVGGEVRLAVEATGICGSDVHGFAGLNDRRPAGVVMGHETVGRVIEVAGAGALEIGARVAVNPVVPCWKCPACSRGRTNLCERRRIYGCALGLEGGLATEMVVAAANCLGVDPDADVRAVAVIEPMSVGLHAVRLGLPAAGAVVLVIGGGPIGIAVALGCVDAGARALVCEPSPLRREVAAALGADTCTPEELPALDLDLDLAFECVGRTSTLRSALEAVRPGGTVVGVGVAEPEFAISAVSLVIEERRVLGSSAYTSEDFRDTARAVLARADSIAALVGDATVALDEMPGVFAGYEAGETEAMKTLYVAPG